MGLAIIFVGVFSHFNAVMFGKPKGDVLCKEVEWSANLPLIILAGLIVFFGIYSIDSSVTLLNNASKIVVGV